VKTASGLLLALALFGSAGCETNSGGTLFNVIASLSSSTCGAAVTVKESEEFQVRVTESDGTLTWYDSETGDTMQGSITNEAFTLAKVNVYSVTSSAVESTGCAVRRHDAYAGTITKSGTSMTKLTATVDSTYEEATGYNCDSLIGADGGFTDLPCEIKYSLVGTPNK
jgi:hypothetical protein